MYPFNKLLIFVPAWLLGYRDTFYPMNVLNQMWILRHSKDNMLQYIQSSSFFLAEAFFWSLYCMSFFDLRLLIIPFYIFNFFLQET